MSYDIEYNLDDVAAADRQAIADTVQYVGTDAYKKLCKQLQDKDLISTYNRAILLFLFAGVQGYPVEAIVRALRPELLNQ